MDCEYLSCAATAKLLRQALKESFPGVKFSVRSSVYAGGASIRIGYVDGPSALMVEPIARAFSGAYFDGMIDYKGYREHLLDGKLVSFGADFVFVERKHSDEATLKAMTDAAAYAGVALPAEPVQVYKARGLDGLVPFRDPQEPVFRRRFYDRLSKASDRLAPSPSATLARVKFYGDDGYGQGTVGKPGGSGGGQAYKAQEEARERQAKLKAGAALATMTPAGRA